jgi:hypothetical protein
MMSRRTYMALNNKKEFVKVAGGWDNPLKYHFLVVSTPDDQLLWSNLDQESVNISPTQQIIQLKAMGIPVPETWMEDLLGDIAAPNVHHSYGTLGWFPESRLVLTHNLGNVSSLKVNVYQRQFGKTHVLIIDDNSNDGMSAVNCVEKVSKAINKQIPQHPWLKGQEVVWIVCNANSYELEKDPAEYAKWNQGNWQFVSRESLVTEINDDSIPKWRGESA